MSETTEYFRQQIGSDIIMAYQIAANQMTLSDVEGHSPTASLIKCAKKICTPICSSWQDVN